MQLINKITNEKKESALNCNMQQTLPRPAQPGRNIQRIKAKAKELRTYCLIYILWKEGKGQWFSVRGSFDDVN